MHTRCNTVCILADGHRYHVTPQCEASGAVRGRAHWLVRAGGRLERRGDQTAAVSHRKGTHTRTHAHTPYWFHVHDFRSLPRAQNWKGFIVFYIKTNWDLYALLAPHNHFFFVYMCTGISSSDLLSPCLTVFITYCPYQMYLAYQFSISPLFAFL